MYPVLTGNMDICCLKRTDFDEESSVKNTGFFPMKRQLYFPKVPMANSYRHTKPRNVMKGL